MALATGTGCLFPIKFPLRLVPENVITFVITLE